MSKSSPTQADYPILAFKTAKAWQAWLGKNHDTANGIWLRFFKKASGQKTVTYDEALKAALCYGWIDGQVKRFDDQSWLQKFTPRRVKSMWSKRNIGLAEALIQTGAMQPAGLQQIEQAKADGRWAQAYDSPKNMTLPDDFMKQLSKNKKALKFFKTMTKANQYAIAWRLQTAKKPETRQRRLEKILEMLSNGEAFH